MEYKQEKIIYLLIGLIVILLTYQAPAMTLQELLESYSFDYAGEKIGVMNVSDFMQDTNLNSVNDTMFFNISIYNVTNGNYVFYIDVGRKIKNKLNKM